MTPVKRSVHFVWLLSVLAGTLAHGVAADRRGWRAFYTLEGVANGAKLAQDTRGNTYVGGTVWEGDPGWGVGIVKYDSEGHQLWAYVFDPDSPSEPRADDDFGSFAVDAQQNVYVAAAHFGPSEIVEVFKLDPDGDLLWRDSGEGYPSELAVDPAGNCFVAGTIGSGFSPRSFLRKYSSSGEKLWERRYVATFPPYWGSAASLALDPAGNIFVVGFQFTISKFDTGGNELWRKDYFEQSASRVLTDSFGNAYVTGPSLEADTLTVKLDPSGQELWRNIYAEPGARWTSPFEMTLDPRGNVFFTAFTEDKLTLLVKLDADGQFAWRRREWTGQDINPFSNVAVDQNGRAWLLFAFDDGRHPANEVLVSFDAHGRRLSRTRVGTQPDGMVGGGDILLDQKGHPVVTFLGQSNGVPGWSTAKLSWTRNARPFWPPHKRD